MLPQAGEPRHGAPVFYLDHNLRVVDLFVFGSQRVPEARTAAADESRERLQHMMRAFAAFRLFIIYLTSLILNDLPRLRRRRRSFGHRTVIGKKNIDGGQKLEIGREKCRLQHSAQLESHYQEDNRSCECQPPMLQPPVSCAIVE